MKCLETDLYNEALLAELARAADDLDRLARALKALKRSNRAFGLQRARAALAGMSEQAEIKGDSLLWGSEEIFDLAPLARLAARAKMILVLARKEIESGESRANSPACAR